MADTRTPEEKSGAGELVEIEHPDVETHGYVPREGLDSWAAEGWVPVPIDAPKAKAPAKEHHHTAAKAGDTPSS